MVRLARAPSALRCGRRIIVALLLLATPAHARAHTVGASFGAVPADTQAIEADPAQRVTAVFTITNPDRHRRPIHAKPILPDGWRLISGGGVAEVAPGQDHPLFIQFLVPARAAPGTYTVLLDVRGAGENPTPRTHSLRVRVRERRGLEVEALDAPRLAMAGAEYRLRFLVRNRGNVDTRVRVEAVEHAGFTARMSWRDTVLAADETRDLEVHVQTRIGRSTVIRHLVELRATAQERTDPDSAVIAVASTTVLVIPENANAAPRFHRLPVQARIVSSSSNGPAGSQGTTTGELVGGGQIADGSRTRVDFRFRTSRRRQWLARNDDEYQASVTSPRFGLQLGDHLFTLSPLTEPGRFGTGVGGRAELAGFSARGFAARNRHTRDGSAIHAGALAYQWNGSARITANYLERLGPDAGRTWSIRGQLTPSPIASLDVEGARAMGGSAPLAISALLSGWHPRLSYRLQHVDVPSEFPTSARGMRTDAGSFALRIAGGLRVQGSASSQRTTRRIDGFRLIRGAHLRAGEVGIGLGDHVSLAHVATASVDSTPTGRKVANESLFRLRAGTRVGPATILTTVAMGAVENTDDGVRRRLLDANLQAGLRLGSRNHVSAYLQRTSGPRWYAPTQQELVTTGLTARLKPIQSITVHLAAAGTRRVAPLRHDYLSAEGTVNYLSRIGHTISVSTRYRGVAGMNALGAPTFEIAYTVPLGVPIGYARSGSRIAGRVYDSQSGKGIANALVLVGDQMAISDKEGRVAMSGLQSGTQYLQLELSGAASDHVALQPLPLPLSTHPGQPARFDVALVRGTRITGKVRRFAPTSAATWDGSRATLSEVAGLPGVVVAMMRDGEVHRRLTDASGEFDASGLRPGRWTIAVDAGELPTHHYIAQPSVTVDVAPGDSVFADFDVMPRKRAIVMIDEGKVIADAAPANRADAPMAATRTSSQPSAHVPQRAARTPPATPAPAVAPSHAAIAIPKAFPSSYMIRKADRNLKNVAIWIYNDVDLWPKLWLANRDRLRSPDALKPGVLLVIPPRAPLTPAEIRARDEYENPSAP